MSSQIGRALRTFAVIISLWVSVSRLCGYALEGPTWPTGSEIAMRLQLGPTSVQLQDGSGTWNNSAADALSLWNQQIDTVHFSWSADSGTGVKGDGVNSVFFSSTVYGQSFGTYVLAVTLYHYDNANQMLEADTIFNTAVKFNSYRGPIQYDPRTGQGIYDFHRVALHEFGHNLGLAHPDEHGQNVVALMNSIISDLDHLADDDIAGGRFLYGVRITSSLGSLSVQAGDFFKYQITANNTPVSYEATGLPPGLALDSNSGSISGSPTLAGSFTVAIVAHGTPADASGTLQIIVLGPRITSNLNPPSVFVGSSFAYHVTSTNNPFAYDATGLPAGLTLDRSSGVISGTPTSIGTFSVIVTAHCTLGDASGTLHITVLGPRITSNLYPPNVLVGDPFVYQITSTNNPFAFDATGLPAGLTLDRNSGVISGTPTSIGTFFVIITAHCGPGDASGTLSITVLPYNITSSPYPFPSPQLGSDFKYQITANNSPASYGAIGLPPGLEVDSTTGLITGVPTLTGTYQFTVIAHGPKGDAVGTVRVTVVAALPLQPAPAGALKTFDISAQRMVFDSLRSRLYASDQSGSALIVIDAKSLSAIGVIKLPHAPYGISISADYSKLWMACSGSSIFEGWISAIDLNNLQILPSNRLSMPVSQVVEGLNNRLYASGSVQVVEVDGNTGALLGTLPRGSGFLATSPDRNTLYVADYGTPSTVWAYDISQVQASLREQTDWNTRGGSSSLDLKVSPNGKCLCLASLQGNGQLYGMTSTALMSTADVRLVLGNFVNNSSNIATTVGPIAFSNDDVALYQPAYPLPYDANGLWRIEIFDIASFSQTGFIDLGRLSNYGGPAVRDLSVDATGAYLFVATDVDGYTSQLRVYSTGRGVPPTAPAAPAHSILNISTRLRVDTGDNVGIGGFIINGNAPKKVMIRALGPSLSNSGVAGAIADPVLELHDRTGNLVAQNDNWNSHRTDVLLTGLVPKNEHESAIIATLSPGAYTAVVRGANGNTGVALVEVYDLSTNDGSRLANISTRGKVEAGDNVMIGGFIIGGDQPTDVIVRAIGPSLTKSNIAGALADPMLEVYDGNGSLHAQDDDWRMYQEQPLIDSGFAPTDDRESAMILQLQPGRYTAIVRGKDNSSGVGLVEAYNLNSN